MKSNVSDLKIRYMRQIIYLVCLAIFSGCSSNSLTELTFTEPYTNVIGSEYRLLLEVNAYGIYENLDKKVISYVTIIPGVGIAGPEVAFKKRIEKGQKIKILSAWQEKKLINSDIYYVIAIQGIDLPSGIDVRIEISRGNEGVGTSLNKDIYERLSGK